MPSTDQSSSLVKPEMREVVSLGVDFKARGRNCRALADIVNVMMGGRTAMTFAAGQGSRGASEWSGVSVEDFNS